MASNAFRDSMNSLGWSRREPEPVTTDSSTPFLQSLSSYNPFNRGGYIGLPTHNDEAPGAPLPAATRREEEEGFFALCFVICFLLFGFFAFAPRKFAILWSMGSLLFLLSWAILLGPRTYVAHLLSGPRLPFTTVYVGSIALTLYFAIGWALADESRGSGLGQQSNLPFLPDLHPLRKPLAALIVIAGVLPSMLVASMDFHEAALPGMLGLELVALLWYSVSYFPMGSTGMRFAARFGTSRAMAWMSG